MPGQVPRRLPLLAIAAGLVGVTVAGYSIARAGWPPMTLLCAGALMSVIGLAWYYRGTRDAESQRNSPSGREQMRSMFETTIQRQQREARLQRNDPQPTSDKTRAHFGGGFKYSQENPLADPPLPEPQKGSIRWALRLLDINEGALLGGQVSEKDILQHYKSKSRQFHPDKHIKSDEATRKWAHEKMAELNWAKSSLMDALHAKED